LWPVLKLRVKAIAAGAETAGEAQHGDGGGAPFPRIERRIAACLRLRLFDNASVRFVANLCGVYLKASCCLHLLSSALLLPLRM
jgi:hypothetical protein